MTKVKHQQSAKADSASGSLPHEDLKMFPTPPSLEHPSPADGTMEVDHVGKMEQAFSPAGCPDLTDWWTETDFDQMMCSSKFAHSFAPLPARLLYTAGLPALNPPAEFKYKPQRLNNAAAASAQSRPPQQGQQQQQQQQQNMLGNRRQQNLTTPNMKMSPISPMTSAAEATGGGQQQRPPLQQGHDMASPGAAKDPLLKDASR